MALHSSMGELPPNEEQWLTYVERLQHYCMANDVVEDKKLAVLFSVCGPYKLIKNLALPRNPSDLSFDSVVDLVKEHYRPKPSVTVQRFKETVATFVVELR